MKEIQGSIEKGYRMIITEKQMVDEGLADVSMVVNYVTKETAGSSAERPLMAVWSQWSPSTPTTSLPRGAFKYIKFLTAFGCTTTW
jgi:hypothetical protein